MNSNQAKKIQIVDYLSRIGIEKINQKGNEYWYSSPFRTDLTPSFKVDTYQNIWYDFGTGEGGNIIDLVMRLHNCNVSESLKLLENSFSFSSAKESFPSSRNLANEKRKINYTTNKLSNKILIDYLQERCINIKYAVQYCVEVYYSLNNRRYFALGFENLSSGYELRNKYVKMCLNKKDISYIQKPNKNAAVSVFEGFFDFLSYLSLYNEDNIDYIVLNSVALVNSSINILNKYDNIELWLDNDDSGLKTKNNLINILKNENIIDRSNLYSNYKDLNEMLKNNKEIYV